LTAYLLDTNHASAFMGNVPPVKDRVARLVGLGNRFYLCMPVVGELFFAVYASTYRERNRLNLERLLNRIAVLGFDLDAAEVCGQIRAELKDKGRPIPGTDAQIAAIARLHGLIVLSSDHHFAYVDGLQIENWL